MKSYTGPKCGGVVFGFWLILCGVICLGQSYQTERYAELEGLPSATVYEMCQDDTGQMWFATRSGIARFDGQNWKVFSVNEGLSITSFGFLSWESPRRVWALGNSGMGSINLFYHDIQGDQRWHRAPGAAPTFPPSNRPTDFEIIRSRKGQFPLIAVSTLNQGLYIWSGHRWTSLHKGNGLPGNHIFQIASLHEKLYVATDSGLAVIAFDSQDRPIMDKTPNGVLGSKPISIHGITIEHHNKFSDSPLTRPRIWLYTPQWVGYFEEGRDQLATYPQSQPFVSAERETWMQPDYQTGIYIGNHYELKYFNYKQGSWQVIDQQNGLIGGGTNGMFVDYEKNIWISCDRGVSKLISRRFSNYQQKNGLLDDETTALLEYQPGRVVLGHNQGLTFYNGQEFQPFPLFNKKNPANPMCRVLDMKLDSAQNIWIALSWGGLVKLDAQRSPTWYGEKDGLPKQVTALWVDARDQLWLGTSQGLYRRTDNGFKHCPTPPFPPIYLRRIFGDNGSLNILGGMDSGVYRLENQQWKNYRLPQNTISNAIYAFEKNKQDQLLIGTLKGVFTVSADRYQPYYISEITSTQPIYAILKDRQHNLWFGTGMGLVVWNGRQSRHYSRKDGLIGLEINRAALIEDSAGRIWIGTVQGLSIFDPVYEKGENFQPRPKLQLLELDASGQKIPLKIWENLTLGYKQNNLTFHFRAISFLDEHSLKFTARLEGLDHKWVEESSSTERLIRYFNLPPGDYRLALKVCNSAGVWSETVYSPIITLRGPFYRSWWFFLLLFLATAFLSYLFFRLISHRRYAALLERQVEERTHQLQSVEQRYRNLFEESKDAVFISTPDGAFLDMNPAGLDIFGYPNPDSLFNIKAHSLYQNPQDRLKFREAIEKEGYVKDYPLELRNRSGEIINGLLTATVVRDVSGQVIQYRGIIRDITLQKNMEQQLMQAQKMEAIGTLAGGIAHDFNNILGVIVGYSELAIEDLPPENPVRQYNQQVLVAAQRARELVNQILAFSRQSEKKRKILHLTPIIKEALTLLRSTLPTTIEIRRDLRAENDVVLADATQIHQVMMNLCANAAHAMKENGGLLEVSLVEVYLDHEFITRQMMGHKDLKPGEYLRLAVKDTGHGIPEIVLKRIFEPYFTTKKTGEGTGMGLAMIHGIIKSHGGDVTVQSEPGKGATFSVFLPRITGEEEPLSPIPENLIGGTEHLLIVDDESMLTRVQGEMLRRLGYQVVEQSDPLEALKLFQEQPAAFDLVISDVTMPHLTGVQLATQLKKIVPGLPVILVSGFSNPGLNEQIEAASIEGFILKPIIKTELTRLVRQLLDRKKTTTL